jgi:hypothetical protein
LTRCPFTPIFSEQKEQNVILDLVKKLRAILRPASVRNGKPELLSPIGILRANYYDLLRLAEQIHAHAERAPYPHVGQRLRQIALEKRKAVDTLREKILSLRGVLEEPQLDLKSGKNHWKRMVRDLEDQKALETRFLEHAARLAEEAPEISDLLKEIVAAQVSHKETLLDLVARADPQADQT